MSFSLSLRFAQQRLREEREQKRASLDERHRHLFDIIAVRLAIDRSEIEDHVLESSNVRITSSELILQRRRQRDSSRLVESDQ